MMLWSLQRRLIRRLFCFQFGNADDCSCVGGRRWMASKSPAASARHDTGICVYNSLTQSVVPFTLTRPNTVHWYMCGPTVYDDAHIGHASCYVKFDILRRIMENFFGLHVVLLLGITDVDDKIIRKAKESNEDFNEVARKYEHRFFADMRQLNVAAPSMTFRVTEHVSEIISFVSDLVEKGLAYAAESGSVYFDVAKYGADRYGRLTPHRIDEARTTTLDALRNELGKRNVVDFALWKAAEKAEPGWPSPWSEKGRPGWHIECSAMASRAFGDTFDVHSGGIDLQFPHHENELAQSCARHSVDQWVNYWWHAGHVLIAGEKMSKSLGNAVSVRQFLVGHEPDALRVACLMSHYRSSMNYTDGIFDEPRSILKRLRSFVTHAEAYVQGKVTRVDLDEPLILQRLDECKAATRLAFTNDFDTHLAIDRLMDFVAFAKKQLSFEQGEAQTLQNDPMSAVTRSPATMALVLQYVRKFTTSLGISFDDGSQQQASHEGQQQQLGLKEWQSAVDDMVKFRKEVREIALLCDGNVAVLAELKRKLLRASDRARKALLTNGFEIQDHRKDSLWIRTKSK